tara:strand:+ start:163 stop:270 length:108 start_codon:yes stop_codon:yes gene_type:complete
MSIIALKIFSGAHKIEKIIAGIKSEAVKVLANIVN